MTQTADRVDSGLEPPMAEPAPRRRLLGRLSTAHLAMLLSGLLAFLLVLVVLRDSRVTTFIATAASDIPAGVAIAGDDIELVEVTGDDLTGVVLTADEVNRIIEDGAVTVRLISAGTLLQGSDFARGGSDGDIRSMSIPVATGRAVAGALRPGDRVDVIASDAAGSWHAVIGIEVLAVAGATASGFAGGEYTVTVAVDPKISLRLACAMANYSIDLVRSTGAAAFELAPPPEECA